MGIFHSKVDVAAIEAIEFNVSDLIIRLGEEEVKIDDYVKYRISKALSSYSNIIEKEKRQGYISQRKMQKMNDLISQANSKLEHLPTIRRMYENTERKTLHQMKTELFEIEKRLNNNRIKEDECQYLQYIVTTYSYNLDSKTSMTQEQENNISVLLLKLFLKSPFSKTSDVLQHIFYNLNCASENFEMFGANSVRVFNAEEAKKHLEEIRAKIEIINQGVNKLEEEVKSKGLHPLIQDCNRSATYASKLVNANFMSSSSRKDETIDDIQISRYENVLKQVETDLYEYGNVVDKFCSPVGDAAVHNLKQKVFNLLEVYLKKIPDEGGLRIRKQVLSEKGMQIMAKLDRINEENKEISENMKVLAEVEDKVTVTVESNNSFQAKKTTLETLSEMVKQINTNNSEVVIQKTEIVNRIEGCLIVEVMIYLRQLKKTVDNNRMYAQQFAYPSRINLYKTKIEEIQSLKQYLDNLPKGNESVDKRIRNLLDQIKEALEIFQCKVKSNDEVIAFLEYLDNIAIEISYRDQHLHSNVRKLQIFNDFRKRIDSVSVINHRIFNKRMEIRHKLHDLEEKIYCTKYPEEMQELKALLNEHEKCSQQFLYSLSSEEYENKREDILTLLQKTKGLMREKYIRQELMDVINMNFDLVLELLEKTSKEVKDSNDRIQGLETLQNEILSLSSKSLSISKKIELLERREGLIKVMRKTFSGCKLDVSTVFDNTEKLIAVEKSKLQLSQLHAILEKFSEEITHPTDTNFFKYKLNEILHLKEHVEDMPEGNLELDSMKQSFAQEVFNSLKKLDEFVATVIKNRKQSEHIMDLQSHFNDFNLDVMDIKRESVEFVQIIRQRAESFENCVKYYLGTNYSVDYYVIHENLMRLLVELDRLSCEDTLLLPVIVDTIGYIKQLTAQLGSNASSE